MQREAAIMKALNRQEPPGSWETIPRMPIPSPGWPRFMAGCSVGSVSWGVKSPNVKITFEKRHVLIYTVNPQD